MRKHRHRILTALALAGLVAFAARANAGPLIPGETDVPPDVFVTDPTTGETLLDTRSGTFSIASPIPGKPPTVTGTYMSEVYQNPVTKFLDFVYQFTVTKGDVERTSHFDYTGAVIYDAGYVAGSGTNHPNTMSRTLDGSVAGFGFLGTFEVLPGESSTRDIYRTLSTQYTDGSYTFQDGSATAVLSFAPLATTPEPSTIVSVLSVVPVVGFYLARRRRRSA
jgi:hypothetical protein